MANHLIFLNFQSITIWCELCSFYHKLCNI